MRWPRRHVVKPTSASRRSVPSTTRRVDRHRPVVPPVRPARAGAPDTPRRRPRSSSSPGLPRRAGERSSRQRPLTSAAAAARWCARGSAGGRRGGRPARGRRAQWMKPTSVSVGQAPAHARGAHGGEERAAFAARDVEAVLAQAREVGRARCDPDAVLALCSTTSPPVGRRAGRARKGVRGSWAGSPAGERAGKRCARRRVDSSSVGGGRRRRDHAPAVELAPTVAGRRVCRAAHVVVPLSVAVPLMRPPSRRAAGRGRRTSRSA